MKKYLITIGVAILATAQTSKAAPLAGCYELNPPGTWAEWLQNGQAGAVGNTISAWDDATYLFDGATIAEVQPDLTGEWDWITRYEGGTLILSNTPVASWFVPCDAAPESIISFPEVIVKTRSTRFDTNNPGRLEFELSGQSGAFSITATYAGTPTITPDGANVIASGDLVSAEICVGGRVRMNIAQSSLNVKSRGVMPVFVYGSADFNVAEVDADSILLECTPPLRFVVTDINRDGYKDLALKFSTPAVVQGLMDIPDKTITALVLTAALNDGTPIAAMDNVRILNKSKPAKPVKPAKLVKPAKGHK